MQRFEINNEAQRKEHEEFKVHTQSNKIDLAYVETKFRESLPEYVFRGQNKNTSRDFNSTNY